MKHKNIILIVFIFIAKLGTCQSIKFIKITALPLRLQTDENISCSDFDNEFNDIKKVHFINQKKQLDSIVKLLVSKIISEKKSLDTRGEMIIYYQNSKKDKICFDQFGLFYNGDIFFDNLLLFEYLKKNHCIGF